MSRAITILLLVGLQLINLPGTRASWEFCLSKMDFCAVKTTVDVGCCSAETSSCCGEEEPNASGSRACCIEAEGGSVFVSSTVEILVFAPELYEVDSLFAYDYLTSFPSTLRNEWEDPPRLSAAKRLRLLQVSLT